MSLLVHNLAWKKLQTAEEQIKKAVDALIRRGHSYGTIKRVLNELSFDSEDYLED